jgi:signal transduction histidine kinase
VTIDDRRFDLAQLGSHDLVALGARVRRCAEDRSATFDEIAGAIVDTLWGAFEERTPPVLALVRLFHARPVRDLSPAQRVLAGGGAGSADENARCLVLAATRGIEPAWNEVARSERHRVLPLSDPAALARTPMIGKLVADLALDRPREPVHDRLHDRLRDPGAADEVFFVREAVGSPVMPEQRGFVLRYGVCSVLGCGGALPDGSGFAAVLFSRVPILPEVAGMFAVVGLHAGLALSRARDLAAPPAAVDAARGHALERLLRLEEYLLLRRVTALARESDEQRQRAAELERTLAEQSGAGVRMQERTQRAMLNVIEDLGEARRDLERRVADRTRDLELRNTELRSINAELEQFAYVSSHDLQEPLRTIAGYLQLLEERYGERLDADGHEFIAYAVGGARRMQELIDALLAYSRVSRAPVEAEPVQLDRALDEALGALARAVAESGAEIDREPLPAMRGDPVLLRQLFQNLLSNAIKFCGAAPPRIEIRAGQGAEGEIQLTVRDHGIGFEPRYAEQVFRVFRRLQRKLPGTGIGLAICKKIVERHGGTIHAVAAPGEGATFHVTFPAAEDAP